MEKQLSDNFELTISDLAKLSKNQIKDFDIVNLKKEDYFLANIIGIDKTIKLYKFSQKEFEIVKKITRYNTYQRLNYIDNGIFFNELFIEEMKSAKVKNMKDICFSYARKILLYTDEYIDPDDLPKEFVKENEDIFLTNVEMDEELRLRFKYKRLSIIDIVNNQELFNSPYMERFIVNSDLHDILKNLGLGNLKKIIHKYSNVLKEIEESTNLYKFSDSFFYNFDDYERNFIYALKNYWLYAEYKNDSYDFKWLNNLNITVIEEYETWEEMKKYNDLILVINLHQRIVLDKFGIENLIRLDEETKFFSSNDKPLNKIIDLLYWFLSRTDIGDSLWKTYKIPEYNEFLKIFGSCLKIAKNMRWFSSFNNYDFIKGEFRKNNPEIFIDENAPEALKEYFYTNELNINIIYNKPEYIPFLLDKDLDDILNCSKTVSLVNSKGKETELSFISYYSKKFGNESTFNLIKKYGLMFNRLSNLKFANTDNEEQIEKIIQKNIYDAICTQNLIYTCMLKVPSFVERYPELFLDLKDVTTINEQDKEIITNDFYSQHMQYEYIQKYPELVGILMNKNLKLPFLGTKGMVSLLYSKLIDNKTFLDLCTKYGKFMNCGDSNILLKKIQEIQKSKISLTLSEIYDFVEYTIGVDCLEGKYIYYSKDENEIPEFLKNNYPELFLSEDAPENLKDFFYCNDMKHTIVKFLVIKENPEWLPYLDNKSIVTPFLRNEYRPDKIEKYFKLFGNNALKLGIQKPETVTIMIDENSINLMLYWYNKTGQKFVPDFTVMQNFDIRESDRFFSYISYWSKLMKLENYVSKFEHREAVLKLAYSFGVFHGDQLGYKKLYKLLTYVPQILQASESYIIEKVIDFENQDDDIVKTYNNLFDSLTKEKFPIINKLKVLNELYRKNNDGSYTLTINPQKYPKSMQALRNYFELAANNPIITPDKIHQFFGGFKMEYDKDFREFLLANLENINEENSIYISSIQRQFNEIKAFNCNRILTLDLAISYVKENKYENIILGNEKMAEISAIAGYSQEDFDILQQIYTYGRIRVFSSIPRIENKTNNYSYEMLRLDDPLALAIGTLTDCCQELYNAAEICMEHSMVDKNGRIFVIRDIDGNIVSQSWVWRNKDVLCFDNIEIPKKAFKRAELSQNDFAKEIYNIYKQAAHELIEEDEKVYKKLLFENKIIKEQYDGLRLGKITVGLGYNDIANAIKNNAIKDNNISRPIKFNPPVDLNRTLYTNDSEIQYILEERKDRIAYAGDNLYVHNDLYQIYDNSNFTIKDIELLSKIELISENNRNVYTNDIEDDNKIVSYIASIYDLDESTTRIIMHPNFTIIFDVFNNNIRIGKLFYQFKIDNFDLSKKVIYQIKLAIEQIADGRKIITSNLSESECEIINHAMNLSSEELDMEKGLIKNLKLVK